MTQTKPTRTRRRGRIFPEIAWSKEKIAQWQSEKEASYQRCKPIFDRLKPDLLENHYNWYIVIDPDTESYILDEDELAILKKAVQSYPNTKTILFRINETGVSGTI